MQKLIFVFISVISFSFLQAQDTFSNMSKLSSWDDNTVVPNGGVYFNEVWGYVDGSGNEYAVMGSPEEVHFIDVSNPSSPVFKQAFPGTYSSIWRDFKSYGNYVYGVHDNGSGTMEGLSIYNMSALPGGAITMTTINTDFGRAHNLFVDEPNKRLYVAGSNTVSSGLIVYDLTNPASPTLLKNLSLSAHGGYVHDLFVRNNIAYCNSESGSNGGMWVYNLTNLNSIVAYAQENTGGYNHSSWMTDDDSHVVYATETSNYPLYIVDVSDVSNGNITNSKSFKAPNNAPSATNNIAHNPLIKGNYCYVSYYEDGVQVWDISDRSNPTLAGYYDMVPNTTYHGTARGVWGVYPFLPSGNILASDDINGLYVLRLNATLPVELTEIKAYPINDETQVAIEWTTASETNNKEFLVERSPDGVSFEKIGRIEGNGHSTKVISYSFIDNHPIAGISYYRLKQVDYDLEFTYSDIVNVRIDSRNNDIVLYPNPITRGSIISLNFGSDLNSVPKINLYDYTGKEIPIQEPYSDNQTISLDIQQLPLGMYILKIELNGEVQLKKFVISI